MQVIFAKQKQFDISFNCEVSCNYQLFTEMWLFENTIYSIFKKDSTQDIVCVIIIS